MEVLKNTLTYWYDTSCTFKD